MNANLQTIRDYARPLRLSYTYQNLEEMLERHNDLGSRLEDFLEDLLHNEVVARSERSRQARIKNAGFPYNKHLEDLEPERLPKDAKTILQAKIERVAFLCR